MKKVALLFILAACHSEKEKLITELPPTSPLDERWEIYEGKWLTHEGIFRLELSITTNSTNKHYMLVEIFEFESSINRTISQGEYTTYTGLPDQAFGIRLRDLGIHTNGIHFRVSESPYLDLGEEMFLITREAGELIPTDKDFKPVTLDKRFTLHKRLNYSTVEGYITFETDSAQYFERNTREYWKVANLGEFAELKTEYDQRVEGPSEGLYLKALAYSIADDSAPSGKSLVIKAIKSIGKDPDTME